MAKKRKAKTKIENDARAFEFIKRMNMKILRLFPCPGYETQGLGLLVATGG